EKRVRLAVDLEVGLGEVVRLGFLRLLQGEERRVFGEERRAKRLGSIFEHVQEVVALQRLALQEKLAGFLVGVHYLPGVSVKGDRHRGAADDGTEQKLALCAIRHLATEHGPDGVEARRELAEGSLVLGPQARGEVAVGERAKPGGEPLERANLGA